MCAVGVFENINQGLNGIIKNSKLVKGCLESHIGKCIARNVMILFVRQVHLMMYNIFYSVVLPKALQ